MENIRTATQKLTMLSMLLALTVALSALEHMLPPIPLLPPNVRLGLSNIVTMYTLFFLGKKQAACLAVLKALFVLLMRGVTAGILSLCGGLLSVGFIVLLAVVFGDRISCLLLSVFGAIAHNTGQILAASVLLGTRSLLLTMPVLLFFGIVFGSVTGILLRVTMPLFNRTFGASGRNQ